MINWNHVMYVRFRTLNGDSLNREFTVFYWSIFRLVAADIAETSVEQAKTRYQDMKARNRGRIFRADFVAADCTKARLSDLYSKDLTFDLVSCQFAFHYCFESVEQADRMLQNVAERLNPGGFFIGTTPDANDVVARLLKSGDACAAGNQVYNIKVEDEVIKRALASNEPNKIPLFGARYTFHLEGVVDCPEFLVHFPTLIRLAKKHGLKFHYKSRFADYFRKHLESGRVLLERMNALETFPPRAGSGAELAGPEGNYLHAEDVRRNGERCGTLSADEWEAATLYVMFAFEKI